MKTDYHLWTSVSKIVSLTRGKTYREICRPKRVVKGTAEWHGKNLISFACIIVTTPISDLNYKHHQTSLWKIRPQLPHTSCIVSFPSPSKHPGAGYLSTFSQTERAWRLLAASPFKAVLSRRLYHVTQYNAMIEGGLVLLNWLKMIIWVIGVLRRRVVADWGFDNLCGSHLQSQVVLVVSWKLKILVGDLIGQ